MDTVAKAFGVAALTMGGMFLFIIFGALLGGVVGWVVGLVFGDIILGILAQLGIKNVTMFQFGVFMGFVGAFMKTKVDVTK